MIRRVAETVVCQLCFYLMRETGSLHFTNLIYTLYEITLLFQEIFG